MLKCQRFREQENNIIGLFDPEKKHAELLDIFNIYEYLNKCQKYQEIQHFSGSDRPIILFHCSLMLNIYVHLNFHAQLS